LLSKFVSLFVPLCMSVLAGWLLWLYFEGAWYDPNKVVEVVEVILLSVLVLFGVVLACFRAWRIWVYKR